MKKEVVLHFSKDIWDKPIIYHLIKNYDLIVNIHKADVLPKQESFMVLGLEGDNDEMTRGIEYLKEYGVTIDPIEQEIKRDEARCTHCGACIAICPTGSLHIKDRDSMEVAFDSRMCSGCELCVPVCPAHAMEIRIV
jgi:ferredoxin